MRKLLLSLTFLFATMAGAQTCTPGGGVTCTVNLNLWLPPFNYPNWNVPMNANSNTIDAFAATVVLFAPAGSQTITQPATTFTNFNSPLVFGSTAILEFGPSANTFDSALTRTAAGTFTLDANVPSSAGGTLALKSANTSSGYQIGGTAPSGHLLCGNGTYYVDCSSVPGTFFYQTVALNGTAQTQRPTLNFTTAFTATDSSSPAETTIGLANTGVTAGSYTTADITVGADGRITSASNGSAPAGTILAVTHFTTCTLNNYSASDTNCYVGTQPWNTTVSGTYDILCSVDHQSYTGGANSTGSLQTVISVNEAENTTTTFAYALANINSSAAGLTFDATCTAIAD